MSADASQELTELETRWTVRERKWAHRLGRLRLGVEPLDEQLTRLRRTTWVLSIVPGFIALIVLTLFTAFARPDVGLVVILILFAPMIVFPWVGYARLKAPDRRVSRGPGKVRGREKTAARRLGPDGHDFMNVAGRSRSRGL